mmetsp:Transcript_32634/g.64716  ORF Transcript_32634/g.64716 Transcript_32634/m.64716 type:complete len:216 (+) Transcript_32634:510-1157(+)
MRGPLQARRLAPSDMVRVKGGCRLLGLCGRQRSQHLQGAQRQCVRPEVRPKRGVQVLRFRVRGAVRDAGGGIDARHEHGAQELRAAQGLRRFAQLCLDLGLGREDSRGPGLLKPAPRPAGVAYVVAGYSRQSREGLLDLEEADDRGGPGEVRKALPQPRRHADPALLLHDGSALRPGPLRTPLHEFSPSAAPQVRVGPVVRGSWNRRDALLEHGV